VFCQEGLHSPCWEIQEADLQEVTLCLAGMGAQQATDGIAGTWLRPEGDG